MPQKHRNTQKIKPILDISDIEAVREILKQNSRDLLLFDLATQTGAGMTHLLRLRVNNLINLDVGDPLQIRSANGKSGNNYFMTKPLQVTWNRYLKQFRPAPNEFIFKSRKGNKPLNLSSVSAMVKTWFQKAGLNDLSGTKSLQKTWEIHFKAIDKDSQGRHQSQEPFINQIKVETIKEKVYQEIYKAIISGRLAPGERLLEEKIAEMMNVSRMPVREALHRLQETGLISPCEKSGKIVNQLSFKSLDEIIKIRIMLETQAARIALSNLEDEKLKLLEEIHSSLVKAINANKDEEMLSLNKQFHSTLYESAGMPILLQMILSLWDRVNPYLHILFRERDAKTLSLNIMQNHQGMIEGLRCKDPDKVCKYLESDLIEARKIAHRLMDRWDIK